MPNFVFYGERNGDDTRGVPPPRKHISLGICVPPPGKHISLVIRVSPAGKHILQGCVALKIVVANRLV